MRRRRCWREQWKTSLSAAVSEVKRVTSEDARGMPAVSLMPRPGNGTMQDSDAIDTDSRRKIDGRWLFRLRGSVGVGVLA